MPSTYSPSLKIELIGDGEQSGTWGQTTNTNLGTLIEQAIAGVITVAMPDADYTLTSFNGTTDQARNAVIRFTGSLAAGRNVIVPTQTKVYSIFNNANQTLTIKTSAGTGIAVPAGFQTMVWCDGTNVVSPAYAFPSSVLSVGGFYGNLTGNVTLSGGTVSGDGTNLLYRTNGIQYFQNVAGTTRASLDASGNFTAAANVTAYSDARLKTDIKTIPRALDKVDHLRGVSFMKDGKENIGVIAQEVMEIVPEVVLLNEDGYYSVAYGNLVGLLIEAVKELRAEVKALKGE